MIMLFLPTCSQLSTTEDFGCFEDQTTREAATWFSFLLCFPARIQPAGCRLLRRNAASRTRGCRANHSCRQMGDDSMMLFWELADEWSNPPLSTSTSHRTAHAYAAWCREISLFANVTGARRFELDYQLLAPRVAPGDWSGQASAKRHISHQPPAEGVDGPSCTPSLASNPLEAWAGHTRRICRKPSTQY